MNKPRITCSFPDEAHETIEFHCQCGESVSHTIDLSRGGEIKTKADRALIEAAFEWVRTRGKAKTHFALQCAIFEHPDYKEE